MKLKNLISLGAVISTFASSALGSVFFTVDVGSLQDEAGVALVNEGMLYLVSSGTDGEFSLPETGGIVGAGSDDAIVASWDLTAEVSTLGEYIVSSGEVAFDGAWAKGHTLAILWFPNLTQGNQPQAGEAYGFYRNGEVVVGDVWEMPLDGTLLHSLKFFTDADNPLVEQGDVPSYVAAASFGAGEDAGAPVINLAGLSTGEPIPGTATFSWTGSTAPGGGYSIERRFGSSGPWDDLGSVSGSTTSFNDPNIGRGKDYEYRVLAVNGFGSEVSGPQPIETLRSTLANLATRGVLGSGDNSLILGFTFKGSGDITLLARTQGPEMVVDNGFDPAQVASDPKSRLVQTIWATGEQVDLRVNDDWGESQFAEITDLFSPRTFALPNSDQASKDSAMVFSHANTEVLTIVSEDLGGAEGLGLVEVFDAFDGLPNDANNRLVNLATRGFVGTGDRIMIGGFIVKGLVDTKVLIRGVGPALPDTLGSVGELPERRLQNPKITLIKNDFSTFPETTVSEVGFNDDWEDGNAAAEIIAVSDAVGATNFVTGSKDAAMVVTLQPTVGATLYQIFLEGVDDSEGIGLLEVFLAD